jgi:ribosomal protein S18 acetylase RimI-like enzyme
VILRAATAADLPFLQAMLYEAATWRPEAGSPVETVLADPHVARYLSGWGRLGDAGVIGEEDRPVGAAWFRLFPADDAGYGFVAPDVPELSIGVAPECRGRGIGTRLLEALVEAARDGGYRAVSLSVEADNPARRLYERAGFVRVAEDDGGAWTMLRELRPSSAQPTRPQPAARRRGRSAPT